MKLEGLVTDGDPTVSHGMVAITPPKPTAFEVRGHTGALVVRIEYDGTVTFGEGVTPDAAARQFYEALAAEFKGA